MHSERRITFKILMSLCVGFISFMGIIHADAQEGPQYKATENKLYWFIPDGMRADPDLFDIFKWAEEGQLPNIKRMMDNGAYGYSIPTFPSHTPTNFATLFTGAYPLKHGVADGLRH